MPGFIDILNDAREKIEDALGRISEVASAVGDGISSAYDQVIADTDGPLVGENRALAMGIFGDSLDYDAIVLNDSSMLADVNQHFNDGSRPFVWGNSVNSVTSLTQQDLIHELMHVWQFQTGGFGYIPNSLLDNTYTYDAGTLGTFGSQPLGERLENFNVEQQAEIVSHYFVLSQMQGGAIPDDFTLHNMVDANGHDIVITDANIDEIVSDLEPFVEEVQAGTPQTGVAGEANEALYEVTSEIGEAGEEVIQEGDEAVHEIGDEFSEGVGEVGQELADGDYLGAAAEGGEAVLEVTGEFIEGGVEVTGEILEGGAEIIGEGLEGAGEVLGSILGIGD